MCKLVGRYLSHASDKRFIAMLSDGTACTATCKVVASVKDGGSATTPHSSGDLFDAMLEPICQIDTKGARRVANKGVWSSRRPVCGAKSNQVCSRLDGVALEQAIVLSRRLELHGDVTKRASAALAEQIVWDAADPEHGVAE